MAKENSMRIGRIGAFTVALALSVTGTALAKPGALFLSSRSFPTKASSEAAARAAAKKASTRDIAPTDPEVTKGWEYRLNLMAFFGRALEDNTVTLTVYDITENTMRLVSSFEQYLTGRGEK